MSSILPNTSSCCECGSPLNITTFEAYLRSLGFTLEALGFYYVETIADLRDIDTPALALGANEVRFAKVEGNLAEDDGLTTWWDWQDTDTSADDGLTVVRPNDYLGSRGGTWHRRAA